MTTIETAAREPHAQAADAANIRKAVWAATVGTIIEWYD